MTLAEFIKSKGITVKLLSQEMKISKQAVSKWGNKYMPTAKSLKRISNALNNLGVETSPVEIFTALQK